MPRGTTIPRVERAAIPKRRAPAGGPRTRPTPSPSCVFQGEDDCDQQESSPCAPCTLKTAEGVAAEGELFPESESKIAAHAACLRALRRGCVSGGLRR